MKEYYDFLKSNSMSDEKKEKNLGEIISNRNIYPTSVKIVEVSPRDGLQSQSRILTTAEKLKFISLLAESGIKSIEVTSFASTKRLPQFADNEILLKSLEHPKDINYSALVFDKKGLDLARDSGVNEVALVVGASNTFSMKNVNMKFKEALEMNKQLVFLAKENNLRIRCYVSCAFGCPYEGGIKSDTVVEIARNLYECGCDEICLSDTGGVATAGLVIELLQSIKRHIPVSHLAVHFHDTYGQAIANILIALQEGIKTIDTSVAGIGGCPNAPDTTGNASAEDVLYLLNGLGIHTGIDINKLIHAGQYISSILGCENYSRVAKVNQPRSSMRCQSIPEY